jgi:hypothetical protein
MTPKVTLHLTGNKPLVFQELQTDSAVTEQNGEEHFIQFNFGTERIV